MVPVVRIFSVITFAFTFYLHSLTIATSVYFNIFSASLTVFLSRHITMSINRRVPFALARIMISGSSLRMDMSVVTGLFHKYLLYFMNCFYWLSYMCITVFIVKYYPYFRAYACICVHMCVYVCIWVQTLSCRFKYTFFFPILGILFKCVLLPRHIFDTIYIYCVFQFPNSLLNDPVFY
jgi:hypothetical protein